MNTSEQSIVSIPTKEVAPRILFNKLNRFQLANEDARLLDEPVPGVFRPAPLVAPVSEPLPYSTTLEQGRDTTFTMMAPYTSALKWMSVGEWVPLGERENFISRIREQVVEMRSMKDGWLNGSGKAPSDEGLDWMIEKFRILTVFGSPVPYLYPTESGGVHSEWSLDQREISLEIDLEKKTAYWHDLDLDTDEVIERPVNCEHSGDWGWIANQLKDAV